jgi:hypothetical protein
MKDEASTRVTSRARLRASAAAVVGCACSVIVYALLRAAQRLGTPEPDPALVLFSAHAGFFWRALLAAHAGGMTGLAAWLGGGPDGARTARVAAWLVPVATTAIVLTAAFLP